MCMENDPNNTNAPATKADLNTEFGKFEQRLDKSWMNAFPSRQTSFWKPSASLWRKSWTRNSIP